MTAGDMIVGTKLTAEIARPLEKVTARLPYMLVADPSQERAAVYRAAADQYAPRAARRAKW